MAARAYRINFGGKQDIIFVEVNELGAIKYDVGGVAKAWILAGESNTEVNFLTGQYLKPVESVKEFRKYIKEKGKK